MGVLLLFAEIIEIIWDAARGITGESDDARRRRFPRLHVVLTVLIGCVVLVAGVAAVTIGVPILRDAGLF